jgi:hypothetical protein
LALLSPIRPYSSLAVHHHRTVLGKEYTACLQRLFKYPPVEDVSGFITKALALINPKAASAKASNTASATSSPIIVRLRSLNLIADVATATGFPSTS